MAGETDIEALRSAVADLAVSVRETNEATRMLVEAAGSRNSSSNITIDAGGWTAGVALGGFAVLLVLFMLFAQWVMWRQGESEAQQEAWIQVWQQRMAQLAEQHKKGD